MLTTIDISKDGKELVFSAVRNSDVGKIRNIYIFDIERRLVTYCKKSINNEFDPRFSNDSKKIVYCSKKIGKKKIGYDFDSHIQVVDRITDNVTEITNSSLRSDWQPRFSWDDKKIVFDGRTAKSQLYYVGDVYLFDVDTKTTTQVTEKQFEMLLFPSFRKNKNSILINAMISTEADDWTAFNGYLAEINLDQIGSCVSLTSIDCINHRVMYPLEIAENKILCVVCKKYIYSLCILNDGKFETLAKSNLCFSSITYCEESNTIFWISGRINLYCMNVNDKKILKLAGKSLFYKTHKWMKS